MHPIINRLCSDNALGEWLLDAMRRKKQGGVNPMAQSFTDIILPGWEVVRKLGEGSFGGVYEIQRTLPGGYVEKTALKKLVIPRDPEEIEELKSQSFSDESITAHYNSQLEDLVKEYQMMQSLNGCPNIVNCHDLEYIQHKDGIGWEIYIRMELLQPLRKVLGKTYQEKTVLKLGLDLCSALIACHGKNIIHRDIKPGNILVSENGTFKLGDFGVAKVSEKTGTGTMTGTTGYMAPEVAKHLHYGFSADIYSLGLVMYWMMNDRTLPFLPLGGKIPSFEERENAIHRRCSGEAIPEPVNGSRELKRIVLKACAYDPKDRYESAEKLAEDLRRCVSQSETKKVPAPIPQSAPEPEELEEETQLLPRQLQSAAPQQEKKLAKAPEENLPVGGSDRPVAGTGETHAGTRGTNVPAEPVNTPKREKRWKPLAIAGIALMILATVGLGISISARTQHGKAESSGMVRTPQPTAEVTLPPETEPIKIHVMAAAEDLTSVDWDKGADQPFWGQTKYLRSDVKSVTFRSSLDGVPNNAWDVSEAKDRSILAWMKNGNLTVAADGKIAPNSNASWLFAYFKNVTAIDFGGCFDTSKVTDMDGMFGGCSNLTELDVSGFDTSMVTDMSDMFFICSSLRELDVSGFDTSEVTDMYSMFYNCRNLTELDVSGFDASKVTDMGWMFCNCSSLTELDVSGFDTSKVTHMGSMFSGCSSLRELDVSGFDTSKVTRMSCMFTYCSSLTELDVSGFDTAEVTDMSYMFRGCSSLTYLDVSGFDTSKVAYTDNIFYGCSSLHSIQCTDSRILAEYQKR